MSDSEVATTYELKPFDAGLAAEMLLRLADLFDGGGDPLAERFLLSDPQLDVLTEPATAFSRDTDHLANRLREVSAAIESQLPATAPPVKHK